MRQTMTYGRIFLCLFLSLWYRADASNLPPMSIGCPQAASRSARTKKNSISAESEKSVNKKNKRKKSTVSVDNSDIRYADIQTIDKHFVNCHIPKNSNRLASSTSGFPISDISNRKEKASNRKTNEIEHKPSRCQKSSFDANRSISPRYEDFSPDSVVDFSTFLLFRGNISKDLEKVASKEKSNSEQQTSKKLESSSSHESLVPFPGFENSPYAEKFVRVDQKQKRTNTRNPKKITLESLNPWGINGIDSFDSKSTSIISPEKLNKPLRLPTLNPSSTVTNTSSKSRRPDSFADFVGEARLPKDADKSKAMKRSFEPKRPPPLDMKSAPRRKHRITKPRDANSKCNVSSSSSNVSPTIFHEQDQRILPPDIETQRTPSTTGSRPSTTSSTWSSLLSPTPSMDADIDYSAARLQETNEQLKADYQNAHNLSDLFWQQINMLPKLYQRQQQELERLEKELAFLNERNKMLLHSEL